MPMSGESPSKPLSVLIIGCGAIAGGYDEVPGGSGTLSHAGAYRHHGDFSLAACVDPDPDRRNAFAARWGVAEAFATLQDCAGRPYDAASVCVPTAHHAEVLDTLLSMPVRAVCCEKPLTADPSDGRRLAAAYADAGRPLLVNYPRRWDPAMAALREEIAAGLWGEVQAVTGLYTKGVLNNASHLIDLIQFLLGPLRPVSGTFRFVDHQPEDPTLDALLRTSAGAPVHLIGVDRRAYSLMELDLVMQYGRVTLEDGGFTIRCRRPGPDPRFAGYRTLDHGAWQPSGLEQALPRLVTDLHRLLTDPPPGGGGGNAEAAVSAQTLVAELVQLSGTRRMKGEIS